MTIPWCVQDKCKKRTIRGVLPVSCGLALRIYRRVVWPYMLAEGSARWGEGLFGRWECNSRPIFGFPRVRALQRLAEGICESTVAGRCTEKAALLTSMHKIGALR